MLNRPSRVEPLLDNLRESEREIRVRPLFLLSPEDADERDAVRAAEAPHMIMTWEAGFADYARKINYGYQQTDDEFLLLCADDVSFVPGWADRVVEEIERTGAGVCGTNDRANPTVMAGKHSTHPLVRRSYCDNPGASLDGPGTVLATAYGHQWCDTELVELAKARGQWSWCFNSWVRHHHFMYDRSVEKDSTYLKGQETTKQDALTYAARRKQWLRPR